MIYTIGHSNHPVERFVELLLGAGISAVADVRSIPYSRWSPQFKKDALAATLTENNIAYVFLGEELGGRPKDASLSKDGKPDYAAMAKTELFRSGIVRVLAGAERYRIALMCAERDPMDCHRFLLIARHLVAQCVPVSHILSTGVIESHDETEHRFTASRKRLRN